MTHEHTLFDPFDAQQVAWRVRRAILDQQQQLSALQHEYLEDAQLERLRREYDMLDAPAQAVMLRHMAAGSVLPHDTIHDALVVVAPERITLEHWHGSERITAAQINALGGTLQGYVDDYAARNAQRTASASEPHPLPAAQHAALNEQER